MLLSMKKNIVIVHLTYHTYYISISLWLGSWDINPNVNVDKNKNKYMSDENINRYTAKHDHFNLFYYSQIHNKFTIGIKVFRGFLSQFSTNFHEISHTLFSIHVVTTLEKSRGFDKYFRSWTIWHVKFWDEANGFIEGNIFTTCQMV